MQILNTCLFLGVVLAGHAASAATQQYAAHEETLYTGDHVIADSGSPIEPGSEGEIFLQFLSYSPMLGTSSVDSTVSWDEAIEQLVGFTQVTTVKEMEVKDTETVTWRFAADAWSPLTGDIVWKTLITTVFDRSPLLTPVVPEGGGGGGSGGGEDPYPTPEQLQEMELAGVPDAACTYLGKCNNYLDGLTRDQYLRDMQAIEAILAGGYTPTPLPTPLVLFASTLSVLLWRARRAPRATASATAG